MEVGKEYGVVDVRVAESLEYSYYLEYTEKWDELNRRVELHNIELDMYNQEVAPYGIPQIFFEGSPELARVEAWKARLDREWREINRLGESLGDVRYFLDRDETTIVSSYAIYWSEDDKQVIGSLVNH